MGSMYHIDLGKSGLKVPAIAVGCMRISNMDHREASAFVDTALSHGANFFDHADVYGGGKSEEVFGKAIAPLNREDILIQTKCAIHDGLYDFSYAHIVRSVDGSLKRLGTDYIDVLLLHRPDALMEPEEVARAFSYLKESGKVRNFGVSNHNPYQIQLLQKVLDMPLCANQLQFGVMHTSIVDSGINVNMYNEAGINRDGGVLDFCRLENITIQPVLERIRNVADEKQADIGGFCSLRKSPPGFDRVDFVIHRILWRRSSAFAGWVNCKDSGFRTDRSRCRPRLFGAELHSAPWPSPPDGSG